MWLSVLSVWGTLLTLTASQSCSDSSENSASWVRLKPLGQCKDGESTCPYRITFAPLTVQLPKSFRELEKIARELQSLTQMVNQLKEDCRVCKERQRMDLNTQTDDEGEDGGASRGSLNTKKRQQDIDKREDTVEIATSRSAVEHSMISSDAEDVNPTVFEKQRNTNQERNVNPHNTKPSVLNNEGSKASKPFQEKTISGSFIKVEEEPSLTTTKKRILPSSVATLTESTFSGDLDSEPPTQHEKHKANTIKAGHEMYPSGTLTAKGRVKSIPEYHGVTMVTADDEDEEDKEEGDEDDDVERKQLQIPKGDKVLGERRLETGTGARNNTEHKPNMEQLRRKQQEKEDKKEIGDTGLKETRSNIFDDANSGNVGKEVSVIQQPTLKNEEKKDQNNHSVSSTKPKPLKHGVYSESDAEVNSGINNTADTIRGQIKITSPVTGRVNTSFNVSQINPQTPEINSKNAIKADTDAKMDTGIELTRFNKAETVSGQAMSRLPTSGMTYGIVDVSPTNTQILDSKKLYNTGTDLESDAGTNSNPVNNADTVNGAKNLRPPISDSVNTTVRADVINPKIQKSNTETSLKSSRNAGKATGMESNPNNKIETGSGHETSKIQIRGITDGIVDVSRTHQQIIDSKTQFGTGTDSDSDAVIDSNSVNDVNTVSGINNSRSFISDQANSKADVDLINPQSLTARNPFTHGVTVKSSTATDSHSFNTSEMVSPPESSFSDITDGGELKQPFPETLDGTFKHPFKPGTDKERKAEMDPNPLNTAEKVGPLKMPQLSITERTDATVNAKQINPQTVYDSKTFNPATISESKATVVSTPVYKVETGRSHTTADQINPQATDFISKNTVKPSLISEKKAGIYPNQDHISGHGSQRDTSKSLISDSRLNVDGSNPSLKSDENLPRRRFLLKSKLNMTQSRNRQIKSSNPMSIDTGRKKALRNNKTTSLRRNLPPELLPVRLTEEKEITDQPERNGPTGLRPGKDPRHKKTYILQEKTINNSKSFNSGELQNENKSGATDYTSNNGTTHVDSKTVFSPSNELNSTAYDVTHSVMHTLATQGMLDQANIKSVKTAPTVEVWHNIKRQTESTSQTTVTTTRLEKPNGISGQDLVLDTVNNSGSDSQPPVVEQTKAIDRRLPEERKTPSRSRSVDSNKKPLRVGSVENPVGKMPLAVESSEKNELKYLTTAATPYTIKTMLETKHSKMPLFTPTITKTPHFMDQDHAEQAKTTSGVKVSNKHVHYGLETPSQEMESKRSNSDTGNKELQRASNGQGSGMVTELQPNSLDNIQNRAIGPTTVIMDIVKARTDSKVPTTPESTTENRARGINYLVMDKVESSTEANRLIPSSDNAPVTSYRYRKTQIGSVESNNRGHFIDNNNGDSYSVDTNRMTGATLHKIPAGHNYNEDNKKLLTINNMDDRQGLKKQLLSNCHGQCDLGPTSQSILNSLESSNSDRGKKHVALGL